MEETRVRGVLGMIEAVGTGVREDHGPPLANHGRPGMPVEHKSLHSELHEQGIEESAAIGGPEKGNAANEDVRRLRYRNDQLLEMHLLCGSGDGSGRPAMNPKHSGALADVPPK